MTAEEDERLAQSGLDAVDPLLELCESVVVNHAVNPSGWPEPQARRRPTT